MSEWQPIETAPKDETDVVLYFESGKVPRVAGFYRGEWLCALHGCELQEHPTHWMPLPPPPTKD